MKEEVEEKKGNCELFACLSQIEPEDSLEEINEIIGVNGEIGEYSKNITWKLSSKESITLTYSGEDPILKANYDRKIIQNNTNDFSRATEISEMLKKGKKITYEEMKEMLGGIEGTLSSKTTNSKTYAWVDENNRVFKATFKNGKNGKCSIATLGD